jgi:hypothetical protein
MSARYHVMPSLAGTWRVKRSGANRATTVHSTQTEAIGKARELAKKDAGGAVIVHRVDGTVRRLTIYGRDPYVSGEVSRVKK